MFYVYILKCSDASYYIGSTDDLEKRVAEHQNGIFRNCYTYSRLPIKLVHAVEFSTREEAFFMERKLKLWSRAKKAALIEGKFDLLSQLSKSLSQ